MRCESTSSRAGPRAVGSIGPESGLAGRTSAGRRAVEVSRDALVVLNETEGLRGEKVLNYARRAAA
ncbi:hypothetical protein PUR49_33615 [Streptomyces sp. BE147]|uniref:hypothetical protein n=1 Tax=Streptomyces sp. BE147 TaxID=3002524 RepID=UPI002E798278|nr:hypothetical protein [Streptomyces sp. BE147]MEE1741415.1 hypothetical protein [Streptomyces sp. BE147]